MKQRRKIKWGEAIAELVIELLLTCIFFGVGYFVLSLLGISVATVDSDLTVLIGILILAVLFGGVAIGVHFVKKRKKEDK